MLCSDPRPSKNVTIFSLITDFPLARTPQDGYFRHTKGCGRSSGVEHNLAKVRVESSNLFARSNLVSLITDLQKAAFGWPFCCCHLLPLSIEVVCQNVKTKHCITCRCRRHMARPTRKKPLACISIILGCALFFSVKMVCVCHWLVGKRKLHLPLSGLMASPNYGSRPLVIN